jgi:hypothetical protein
MASGEPDKTDLRVGDRVALPVDEDIYEIVEIDHDAQEATIRPTWRRIVALSYLRKDMRKDK